MPSGKFEQRARWSASLKSKRTADLCSLLKVAKKALAVLTIAVVCASTGATALVTGAPIPYAEAGKGSETICAPQSVAAITSTPMVAVSNIADLA